MLQALNLPKKVYFKPGCMPVALRELGDIYRCQRTLLVTDPELYRAGGRPAQKAGDPGGGVFHHRKAGILWGPPQRTA